MIFRNNPEAGQFFEKLTARLNTLEEKLHSVNSVQVEQTIRLEQLIVLRGAIATQSTAFKELERGLQSSLHALERDSTGSSERTAKLKDSIHTLKAEIGEHISELRELEKEVKATQTAMEPMLLRFTEDKIVKSQFVSKIIDTVTELSINAVLIVLFLGVTVVVLQALDRGPEYFVPEPADFTPGREDSLDAESFRVTDSVGK